MDYDRAIQQAAINNRRLNSVIKDIAFITESRVTYNNTQLVRYMNLLYGQSMYHCLRGLYHASPGLMAILLAIWGVVKVIYEAVSFMVELLKIKEILQIAELLRIVWPKFREKYDAILAKVSEFSNSIGWGVDGVIHLIQAAQGGLNVIKGVTDKSFEWLEIAGAEKAMRSLAFVSSAAHSIADDPASVLDLAFNRPSEETSREIKTWWDSTMDWLNNTAEKTEQALVKVNDTIDNLQELRNDMPLLVRDFIPDSVFSAIDWVDDKIDNTILPAVTNISNELTEINDELKAEREKAAALAAQLMRPGDILTKIDSLGLDEKIDQELKIDDITSRIYEKETDQITESDGELLKHLLSIQELYSLDTPVPEFTTLERIERPGIVWDKVEEVKSWFVGDY